MRGRHRLALVLVLPFALASCDWFTDFKQQPKIDPWESPADSIPPRANPQWSVPITGSAAPDFMYGRNVFPATMETMNALTNPVPADSASVSRGRILFQTTCAVCHGASGSGGAPIARYGFPSTPLAGPTATVTALAHSDGMLFAIMRNGRGAMPSYARLEDGERWDIVNYIRTLQGRTAIAIDTSHGRPGETGAHLPGASATAPTRPAPYFRPGMRIAPQPAAPAGGAQGTVPPAVPPPADDPHAGHMMPPPVTPPDTTKGA